MKTMFEKLNTSVFEKNNNFISFHEIDSVLLFGSRDTNHYDISIMIPTFLRNSYLSNFKSRTLENTGIFSVFGASALPFSLIFSLTGENKGKFFYMAPTTLSSSLAEVRLASLVAWA